MFGPYRPRADASVSVARELSTWFDSFSPGGAPRIDVLTGDQRDAPPASFLGHRGFFTDANGCVSRTAWRQVPFRPVAYAEDHLLAQDMLRAGFAKVYVPDAAVIHSHEYGAWDQLRRNFDEARAVSEIYGQVPGGSAREAALALRGGVSGDLDWAPAPATDRRRPTRSRSCRGRSFTMARARPGRCWGPTRVVCRPR